MLSLVFSSRLSFLEISSFLFSSVNSCSTFCSASLIRLCFFFLSVLIFSSSIWTSFVISSFSFILPFSFESPSSSASSKFWRTSISSCFCAFLSFFRSFSTWSSLNSSSSSSSSSFSFISSSLVPNSMSSWGLAFSFFNACGAYWPLVQF